MTPEGEETKETNYFRLTLGEAKTTATTARDTILDTPGTIVAPIANPLAQGGWVCDAADDWIAELTIQLTGVDTAFNEAISTIQTRYDSEPEKVDAGDPHGNAWPGTWGRRFSMM